MPKLRLLSAFGLSVALLLPVPAAHAQEGVEASPEAATTEAIEDTRISDLTLLVPENLAGLPLRENLQVATGEQLLGEMSADERAIFEALLTANGKTITDYAAANAIVPITDTDFIVVQPHRISGIDAAATIDAWIELLDLDAQEPRVTEQVIAGRDVTLLSDDARPDFPLLHLFAAADIVWMVVAEDDSLVEEAVRTLAATASADEVAD
jgi:hypothetical protein